MKFWEELPFNKTITLLCFAVCSVIYTISVYIIQGRLQWWALALSSVALTIFLLRQYGLYLERKRKKVYKITIEGSWVPGVGKVIKLSDGSHAVVISRAGNIITVKPLP
jgi:hypothetical protein